MPPGTKYLGINGEKTKCICPLCGETHTLYLRWIGRGTPKKFCPQCKEYTYDISGGLNDGAVLRRTKVVKG